MSSIMCVTGAGREARWGGGSLDEQVPCLLLVLVVPPSMIHARIHCLNVHDVYVLVMVNSRDNCLWWHCLTLFVVTLLLARAYYVTSDCSISNQRIPQ